MADSGRRGRAIGGFSVLAAVLCLAATAAGVERATIWDHGIPGWTTTFAEGDPVDTGAAQNVESPVVVADSAGRAYVAFIQSDGASKHLYLSRFDGATVRIWDGDTNGWVASPADGDPIDNQSANNVTSVAMAADSSDNIYIAYTQSDGVAIQLYLMRYDGTSLTVWDTDTTAWVTSLSDGNGLDQNNGNAAYTPKLAVDSADNVYVSWLQDSGGITRLWLDRYDGTDVRIWDNDTSAWVTGLGNGDPIDNGTANNVIDFRIATDTAARVYVGFVQSNGAANHAYLTRYDGVDVKIWDTDGAAWTDTFTNGDPIDNKTANNVTYMDLAVDTSDNAYVALTQSDGVAIQLYLVRYDGTDVRIWDNDTTGWITTFGNGDALDPNNGNAAQVPALVVDSSDNIYIAWQQASGGPNRIWLDRYDGTDVRIWDNDTSAWITNFGSGDPIDSAANSTLPGIALDASDNVYVTFIATDGANNHAYLSRYDGTDVKIWDNDASAWTDTFAGGDPIDTGTANHVARALITPAAKGPNVPVSAAVYVASLQSDGAQDHVYLSRLADVSVPTVTTSGAGSISTTSATSGGNVTSSGGLGVTARGVVWNTAGMPTTADSKTSNGTGPGVFNSNLTGLTAARTYYVRAYATNELGTSYGNQVTFSTGAVPPRVTTKTVSGISDTGATSGGRVTASGGAPITARGVVWNTTGSPTLADASTNDGTGIGKFVSELTGLTPETQYHVRAYATSSAGTSYGSTLSFTTAASDTGDGGADGDQTTTVGEDGTAGISTDNVTTTVSGAEPGTEVAITTDAGGDSVVRIGSEEDPIVTVAVPPQPEGDTLVDVAIDEAEQPTVTITSGGTTIVLAGLPVGTSVTTGTTAAGDTRVQVGPAGNPIVVVVAPAVSGAATMDVDITVDSQGRSTVTVDDGSTAVSGDTLPAGSTLEVLSAGTGAYDIGLSDSSGAVADWSLSGLQDGSGIEVYLDAGGNPSVTATRGDGSRLALTMRDYPRGVSASLDVAGGSAVVEIADPSGAARGVQFSTEAGGEDVSFTVTYQAQASNLSSAKSITVDVEDMGSVDSVMIEPIGLETGAVVTVSLPYTAEDYAGGDEADLRLLKLNAGMGRYEQAGGNDVGTSAPTGNAGDTGVDTTANEVWAEVTVLGRFAITPIDAASDDEVQPIPWCGPSATTVMSIGLVGVWFVTHRRRRR